MHASVNARRGEDMVASGKTLEDLHARLPLLATPAKRVRPAPKIVRVVPDTINPAGDNVTDGNAIVGINAAQARR